MFSAPTTDASAALSVPLISVLVVVVPTVVTVPTVLLALAYPVPS